MNISPSHPWLCEDNTQPFSKKAAYFSMEIAVDQSLKTYSGGLGYLAGSHMRSVFALKQNTIGISILWKKGYYTQERNEDRSLRASFIDHRYSFLQDTGLDLLVKVHDHEVHVKVYFLPPDTFGTAPIFFLSTDTDANDYISRTITDRLYDANTATKIAQSIILGVGGAKLLEELNLQVDIHHMNEGHAVPLVFYLYAKSKNMEEVKKKVVFTTHTPEKAGNEEHPLSILNEMSFFSGLSLDEVRSVAKIQNETLDYTLTALRFSKKANGVSKMHGEVAQKMWQGYEGICPIISITNAQQKTYWVDEAIENAYQANDDEALRKRKKEMKKQLFSIVADQEGKLFDPNILTMVWSRRFAQYKRAWLILQDFDRFVHLVSRKEQPIQVIWAGKPYPFDTEGINLFNYIQEKVKNLPNCAVLVGYELSLSASLKKGADVWLNTPRVTREASGTSGISAAMNGCINVSVLDGWVPEFAKHGENSFVIPTDASSPIQKQDEDDHKVFMDILEKEVIPTYYNNPTRWIQLQKNAMKDVYPQFDSDRMVREYYEKLYV
jgi:starch phosphorylase